MATFHTDGKFNIIILVYILGVVHVTKECLSTMFGFLLGSISVLMDFACDDNNKVTNEIYQVPLSKSQGLHWLVIIGRYRVVKDHLLSNSQDIIVTPKIPTFVANKTFFVVDVWKELDEARTNFPLLELIFIELCDSSNEDGTFFPFSKANYLGSNVPLASWASIFQCDQSLEKNHVSCH